MNYRNQKEKTMAKNVRKHQSPKGTNTPFIDHDTFKHIEVNVEQAWREGTDPDAIYFGECYFRAFRYATSLVRSCNAGMLKSLDGVYLVHGETAAGFALGGHAWVELPGGVIFDGVYQRFYSAEGYAPLPWYKFTVSAAGIIMANMQPPTLYRWDHVLKLPWGDPKNPLVIDYDDAVRLLISSGLRPDLAQTGLSRGAKRRRGA
jgi:hypothetical protein